MKVRVKGKKAFSSDTETQGSFESPPWEPHVVRSTSQRLYNLILMSHHTVGTLGSPAHVVERLWIQFLFALVADETLRVIALLVV